jgi:hypothetical protein
MSISKGQLIYLWLLFERLILASRPLLVDMSLLFKTLV